MGTRNQKKSGNAASARAEEKKKKLIEQELKASEQAREWGERIDTGKTIARGGKSKGDVPGATEQD